MASRWHRPRWRRRPRLSPAGRPPARDAASRRGSPTGRAARLNTRTSIRLGRLFGIEIGANWSLLVVFLLITSSLASGILPLQMPGQSAAAYTLAAGLTAVAFSLSLVAHELGHALLARRYGVRVRGITLWLFGGVATFESQAPSPGADAAIAAVGPLVSLVLGGLLLGLAAVLPDSLPAFAILWLGWINLSLAAFNLLPAFPLDGGRLLGALLWRRSGDRLKATAWAARVGRVLAAAIALVGLVELVVRPGVAGLWLVLLGWFIYGAARAEASTAGVRHALQGVRVRDVMSSPVVLAPDWVTVQEFLVSHRQTQDSDAFPLRDFEGRLSGMVRLRSLLDVPPAERRAVAVREVAQKLAELPRTTLDEPLVDLLQRLEAGTQQRVLVLDGGLPVGIVTEADLARAMRRSG